MGMYHDMQEVLKDMVQEISTYNQGDMLNGYMNSLAEQFNASLNSLGLPEIKYFHKYDILCQYNETRDEVEVYDLNNDNAMLFIIQADQLPDDIEVWAHEEGRLQYWVEQWYDEEISDLMLPF